MKVKSVSEVLLANNGYFFNNLFAKLRYFGIGMSSKHIHMTLIALKEQVPELMGQELLQLLELISLNIDSAMLYGD